MSDALPTTLLDAAALTYVKYGASLDDARDLVTLRCLEGGDPSAFTYFVLAGHCPGREVIEALALMAQDPAPAAVAENWPFQLVTKPRKPGKVGKRTDPLVAMRDELIALNVMAEIRGPGQYESAISTVYERLDGALSEKTIRNAYDRLVARKGNKPSS